MSALLTCGEVVSLGSRKVRISSMPDSMSLCRDHRGRIAVRNVETNRLSYLPEWTLLKAKGIPIKSRIAALPTTGEPLRAVLLEVLGRYGIFPSAWHNQNGDQFVTDLEDAVARNNARVGLS